MRTQRASAKGGDLADVHDAVAVEVLPDPHIGKGGVRRVDLSVAIGIEGRQRVESVLCGAAKQIGRQADHAVGVPIENHEPVRRRHPTDSFGEAVAREVQMDLRLAHRNHLKPVSIQVDDQRIMWRRMQRVAEVPGGVRVPESRHPQCAEQTAETFARRAPQSVAVDRPADAAE